jgi:hypothetical protein
MICRAVMASLPVDHGHATELDRAGGTGVADPADGNAQQS